MKLIDFIKMSFKNLLRKKIRTLLTVISVAIGSFAIITMVSLGIGMKESYKEQVMEMGSLTTIDVNPYNYPEEQEEYVPVKPTTIDDSTVAKIMKIDHVRAVTPILYDSFLVKSGKYEAYMDLKILDFDTLKYFSYPDIVEGKAMDGDIKDGIIVGAEALNFYKTTGRYSEPPEIDLYSDKIKLLMRRYEDGERKEQELKAKIIGKFDVTDEEVDWYSYMDIEKYNQLVKENEDFLSKEEKKNIKEKTYENLMVSVDNIENVQNIQKEIKAMGYGANSLGDILNTMQETSQTIQLVLGGIGGISLFIAAIGIANTMVMSTYERTREIGVMKVLGCKVGDIRKLFLLEAAIIGFLGGLIGIGLSYTASWALNKYGGTFFEEQFGGTGSKISVIPIWLSLSSLAFSFMIGIISGYFPARRATKIKALEALKTE